SFGGGWFFLSASEAITVLNKEYTLPGIGSYVALAIQAENVRAIGWAILTMILMILVFDQFLWKPLVTLADRYKFELSVGEERHFWLVDLWRAASLPEYARRIVGPLSATVNRTLSAATPAPSGLKRREASKIVDWIYNSVFILAAAALVVRLA